MKRSDLNFRQRDALLSAAIALSFTGSVVGFMVMAISLSSGWTHPVWVDAVLPGLPITLALVMAWLGSGKS